MLVHTIYQPTLSILEVRVVGYNVCYWIENYGYLRDYDSRESTIGGRIGGDKLTTGAHCFHVWWWWWWWILQAML